MAHSQLCPCPNCSAARPGGVLMLAAVIIALALAGGAAASITAVVHALITAACVAVLAMCVAAIGGYIAYSAVHDRRLRANTARAIPLDELATRRSQRSQRSQRPRRRAVRER